MKAKRKNFKVIGMLLGFSFLVAISLSLWGKDDLVTTQEESQRVLDAMNKEYAEDTYGGVTPEQTIKLFTDALRRGDIALASMYFLPEDRMGYKTRLDAAVSKGLSQKMLESLTTGKVTVRGQDAFFEVIQDGVSVAGMVLGRNSYSGKWKIIEF